MSKDVSTGSGDAGTATRGWMRPLALTLVPSVAFMLYQLAYQVTKPSPLSRASWSELVPVVGFAVVVAVCTAVVATGVALLVNTVASRITARPGSPLGTLLVTGGLYAVALVAFLENFVYSATGRGMKTGDEILPKAVFLTFTVTLGLLLALRMARMADRSVRVVLVGTGLLLVPSVVLTAQNLASTPPAPALAAAEGRTFDPLNVIILSSDGVDADRTSVYGYERQTTPFLDQKGSEFRVFENAFANNGNTTGSITSLLNGMSPLSTRVVYPPDALSEQDARRTLPYFLGQRGYYRSNWAVPHYADATDQNLVEAFDVDNGVTVTGSPLNALPLGLGPARWFVTETLSGTTALVADMLGIEEIDNPYGQVSLITGDTMSDADRLTAVTDEIKTRSRFFINTHFMVTHGPAFRIQKPVFSSGQEQQNPWQRDFYDDALLEFDSYVARVYEALETSGKLDDTILIVTSDHGIEYDTRKRVPLMIRFPRGRDAGRSTVNVQRMDIAPTILDALGLEKPAWMVGESLLRPEDLSKDRQILATGVSVRQFSNHFGFRSGRNDLVLTSIRCQSWIRRAPDGSTEKGAVTGSTSRCREEPVQPAAFDG